MIVNQVSAFLDRCVPPTRGAPWSYADVCSPIFLSQRTYISTLDNIIITRFFANVLPFINFFKHDRLAVSLSTEVFVKSITHTIKRFKRQKRHFFQCWGFCLLYRCKTFMLFCLLFHFWLSDKKQITAYCYHLFFLMLMIYWLLSCNTN